MTNPRKRSVLITGCSANSLGYSLALAFHDAGFRVFATARRVERMAELAGRGVETLELDVLEVESIQGCVEEVRRRVGAGGLDCLVNNAGGGYNIPITDMHVPTAKSLFDLNVWSYITITNAFLPLLLTTTKHGLPALILNNTSVSSVENTPFNSVYHASKAAAAMFSAHMRLELRPFNVKVVDLKTGCVHSRFHANHADTAVLPGDSLYAPVRSEVEEWMRCSFSDREEPEVWARNVVGDVLRCWDEPPREVWRGKGAWTTWMREWVSPIGWWDGSWRRSCGLEKLEGIVKGGKET